MPEFCNIIKVVQVVIYTDNVNMVPSYQNIPDLYDFKSTAGHLESVRVGHIESVGHSGTH